MLTRSIIALLIAVFVARTTSAAECCTSILPKLNTPTAYGFGLLRPEHRKPDPEIILPLLQEESGSLESSQLSVLQTEGQHGPYAENLVPRLLEVSSALLANADVDESIKALSRALHLTRVNNGLDTELQIPILEQLIGIHLSAQRWNQADQHLDNQYRVQQIQYSGYDPELLEQVKRYADWQRTMYLAGVDDKPSFVRLLSMHEIYTGASDLVEGELGEHSKQHLPYLYGKLEAEHLISLYQGERETGFRAGMHSPTAPKLPTWEKQRFDKIKKNNYRSGRRTVGRILKILSNDPDVSPRDVADAKLALGDWYTWFYQPALAKRSYTEAYNIMAQDADGEAWLDEKFGEPRELPATSVFQPGVIAPTTSYKDVAVRLRFDVSRLGKARRIEILSPDRKENENATIRAYKMVRDTRFRPAMRQGELVASRNLERDYKIAY